MHWRANSVSLRRPQLSLLLLLLCFSGGESDRFAGLLQSNRVGEKFGSLTPRALLAKHRLIGPKDANDTCGQALDSYTRAIDRQELWALKMLDASSTVPSGILQGNIVELGSYDECVRASGESAGVPVSGQHCMYEILEIRERSIIPYNPTMSICMPRSCDADDLAYLVKATANGTGNWTDSEALPVTATCTNEDWEFWDAELVFLMCIVGVYVGFLIVCTIRDLTGRWSRPDGRREEAATLARFSFIRSSRQILTLKPQPGNVPVINGIRVISSLSIILVHEYIFFGLVINSNVFYIYEWLSSWRSIIPIMSTLSVDTFFTLSGFLMISSFHKQIRKNNFNVLRFYLHRFLRLTAPIVPLIFMSIILLPKLGSGPRWQWTKEIFLTSCHSKWWSLLLHVQNLVQTENYCLLELWTCSVDMQLYTISLLIVYLFSKKPQIAVKMFVLLIATSMIITAAIVGINGYHTTYISREVNAKFVLESFNNVYLMTYTRSSPFFLGVLLGYLVENKNVRLTKAVVRIGWTVFTISFLMYPIALKIKSDANYEYTLIFEMICSTLLRPVWSLLICWIIYSCINGAAGPVAKFLSWKYFLPLSRLSYSIYLVHLIFPIFRTMTSKTSMYFSDWILIHSFLSNLILSFALAFLFCVTFEMPSFALDDVLLGKKNKTLSEVQELNNEKMKNHTD